MKRLPLTVQNAYIDLLRRIEEDAVLGIGGQPVLRPIKGRKYWYSRLYVGTEERERYLGPDTPELRARLERLNKYWYSRLGTEEREWCLGPDTPGPGARFERLKKDQEGLRERERIRRSLVKAIQVQEVPRIDATACEGLQALARAGVFQLRAVLAGAHAFRLYPLVLGTVIPEAHHAPEDSDAAPLHEISIGLDDRGAPKTKDALAQVGTPTPAASLYQTQPTGFRVADTLVELLTPDRGPNRDEPQELPALGACAKPLRFLDFLLSDAISAAVPYRYGVLVNVPRPARYAVHKLIVATQRTKTAAAKARKDIEQAMALVQVLAEDQPYELARVYHEACDRGEQWRRALIQGTDCMRPELKQVLRDVLAASEAKA